MHIPLEARRAARPTYAPRLLPRRSTVARYLFLLPATLFMLIFFVYPVIDNLLISVQDTGVTALIHGNGPFIGLANYTAVLYSSAFQTAARTTAIFTAVSLAVQFALGLGLALYFNRSFPLSRTIRALLLLPNMLPFVVTGTAFRWLFTDPNGFVNYVGGDLLHVVPPHTAWLADSQLALPIAILANIWIGVPFNMVLLYGGLQGIPQEIYEASAIDGAGAWMRLRRITLPLLRPVISVLLILGFIATIKVFGLVYLLTGGGPAGATQTFLVLAYNLSFQNFQFGQGAAVGNIVAVIALIGALAYLAVLRREESLS